MSDSSINIDSFVMEMRRNPEMVEDGRQHGFVLIELFDAYGRKKHQQFTHNLITDAGDLYEATRIIKGVGPANPGDATLANGMKLGTGTTAASKNSTGAALITYLSASNQAFDASYAQTTNLGAGLGVTCVYKVTYAAGTATNTALTEAVIVNDEATNATTSAANTYSRVVFGAVNKGASDILALTWSWKLLGS